MQIGKDELLAGVPAKRLRDILAKMDNAEWSREALQEELAMAPAKADDIMAKLLAARYFEAVEREEGWYRRAAAARVRYATDALRAVAEGPSRREALLTLSSRTRAKEARTYGQHGDER